jgi:hypothetical protein
MSVADQCQQPQPCVCGRVEPSRFYRFVFPCHVQVGNRTVVAAGAIIPIRQDQMGLPRSPAIGRLSRWASYAGR